MAYTEKRGEYYRGRYKDACGKYPAVKDEFGEVVKFRTEREAKRAANDAEAAVRTAVREGKAPPSQEVVTPPTFGEYVSRWYAAQQGELASSTLENYLGHIEAHLLPAFAAYPLPGITGAVVDLWESEEKKLYKASSVQTYRSILHLILGDAIDEGAHPGPNPAARRRGRGRRSGRSRARGPEKAVTDALGALLIAERAALLTGRDDEFVMVLLMMFTGMRWGEVIGLEPQYVRHETVRVEHQLYELNTGTIERCPPKDDSYRTIDCPKWLLTLVREHLARIPPTQCACHGYPYVFRSGSIEPEARITRAEIAAEAGVSAGTVSRALTGGQASTATRERVMTAVARLRATQGPGEAYEAHWSRKSFRPAVFAPAASGWYPKRGANDPARPVCVLAAPWPGTVVKGRYSADKADACWAPIEARLTPHGLRHSHKTMMEDLGTPKVLMDERMGHTDGSVSARYSHITDGMRLRLLAGLTDAWEQALAARAALHPTSPVAVLDRLLREHAAQRQTKIISRNSPSSGEIRMLIPRQVASDLAQLQKGQMTTASYFMKSPPVQYFDDEALANVEKFIKGEVER